MKKLFLSILTFALISLSALADEQKEALDFFNSYVNAANTYSPTVAEMYSPTAKIIRQINLSRNYPIKTKSSLDNA